MGTNQYLATVANGLTSGNEIPSLPQIIVEIQKATEKEETSVQELAQLILDDLSLTGKVLKLANSAYYRRSAHYISTVTQAIILLGFGEIQKMVMAISAYQFFSLMTKKSSFRDIWKHSMCVGICSQRIAETLELDVPESYLVGGLLHDIGKFVAGQYFPNEYDLVIQKVKETGCHYEVVEKELFGCTHHEIGVLIAKHWNLSEDICQVISNHEFHDKKTLKYKDIMTQIISISDLIAKKTCGFDKEQEKIKMSTILTTAEEIIEINQEKLMEIIGSLGDEIYRIAHMLDIAIDELKIDLTDEKPLDDDTDFSDEDKTVMPIDKSRNSELLELSLKVQEICMDTNIDFNEICHDSLHQIKQCLDLKYIGVFVNNGQGHMTPIAFLGPQVEKIVPKILFQANQPTLLSYTYSNNKSFILNADLHRELSYNSMLTSALGSSKLAAFPLTIGKDPMGVVLAVKDQRNDALTETEKRVISGCVHALSAAYAAYKK